VVSYLLVQVLF